MTAPFRVAVIPTRDRHRMLFDAVQSLAGQCDRVIILDNNSNPPIREESWGMAEWWETGWVGSLPATMDPPNISALWNVGLAIAEIQARDRGATEWDVAVLNSDVVVPRGWMEAMSREMRQTSAVLVYPDQAGGSQRVLHTLAEPIPLSQRITGYAHVHRGETGLRYDETMAWWYSDDDMDWTARQHGGALLVPGWSVEHRDPNGSTNARPELQIQAGKDRETFAAKWGRTPH